MALTLEEMAVKFSSNGDAAVIQSFDRIGAASTKSREVITQNFEQTATLSKGAVKKMENLGIQMAFIFATMANDGKISFQTLLQGISSLGFAFGPVVGIITTAAGAIGSALIGMFQKSREEAEKTKQAMIDVSRQIAASGSLAQAALRQQQLFSGGIVTGETEEAKLIRAGGLIEQQRQLAELQRQRDQIAATRPAGGFGDPVQQQKFNAALAESSRLMEPIRHNIDLLNQGIALNKPALDAAMKKESEMAQTALDLAQERRAKEIALAQHRYDLEVAMLAGNIAEQARLTAEWVDRAAALYGRDSQEFRDAQLEKLKFAKQMGDEIGAAHAATLNALPKPSDLPIAVTPSMGAKHAAAAQALLDNVTEVWKKNKPKLEKANDDLWADLAAQAEAHINQYRVVVGNIGSTIGQSLTAGISEALKGGGVSGALGAFGEVILGALGGFFTRWGEALIGFGAIMEKLATWMAAHPIFSGPAAIAAGIAMIALGSTLSGIAAGGGGGTGGAAYSAAASIPTSTTQTTTVMPYSYAPPTQATTAGMSPVTPVVNNVTVIGKDDPAVQRQMLELINRAQLRGTSS